MNTTSNKGRTAAYAAWAAGFLGLCVLALVGCSDHGPVGIYSPELFNKNVGAPDLAYYGYSVYNNVNETFTAATDPGPSNANIQPLVVIVNTGGSGTYEPVTANFSCTDANYNNDQYLVFEAGNAGAWTSSAQNAPNNVATAVSQLGAGNEILGFSQTQVALYQGYYNGSAEVLENNLEYSFNAYYMPNPSQPINTPFTVSITLAMTDGLKTLYPSTTFDIWVSQTTN